MKLIINKLKTWYCDFVSEEKINYDQVRKEAMIVDRENIRQEMKEIDSSLKQHLGMDREEYNAKYYFGWV